MRASPASVKSLECLGRKPQAITHLYSSPGDWPEHFRRVDQHDAADLRIKEMFKRLRDGRLKSRPRIRRGLARLYEGKSELRFDLFRYGCEQGRLVGEVMIEGAGRHLRRLRDRADGGSFVAESAENGPRGRQDFAPCPLAQNLAA